ncbi:MAG: DUF1292 domain-containing protein [Clostridiales bacterium]|nr:DUF1292 domain-containing protein [Clostridiales bacterium]
MSQEERLDIVEGTDEDGNRLLLSVEKYFFYNGEEYVVLREVDGEGKPTTQGESPDTVYIMRVAVSTDEDGEEIEDFEPVEEELVERLIPVIRARYDTMDSVEKPE